MRDNELQALTRVLQNKLIQSETRFVELSESLKDQESLINRGSVF